MTDNSKLGVYFNGFDWVIAESVADANTIMAEIDASRPLIAWTNWRKLPNDESVVVWDYTPENQRSQTAIEWAQECGRELLCSTEF